MKKALILTTVIVLLLAAAGCSSTPTTVGGTTAGSKTTIASTTMAATAVSTTKATTAASTTKATTAQVAAELGKPIIIGDYIVTVQKVVKSKDYNGKDAITVVYDWTNNSSKTIAPIWAVSFKVFQDGKELKSAILLNDKSADSVAEVRPAISVAGLGKHFNTSTMNELEIEISEAISFGKPPVLLKVPFPQS